MLIFKGILIGASLFFITNSYSQSVDVPNGVIYHKTTDEKNSEAKKTINQAVATQKGNFIFETTIMVGPNLWRKFINSEYYTNPDMGIDLNFKIPNGKEITNRKGRILKKSQEFENLWKFVCDELKTNSKLRIPTKNELEYYWSIIAFDIEEPLFVVENGKSKILLNINPTNSKLIFIESL